MTREIDFSSMHPRMMYASVGQEAPEDAYELPGWPQEVRPYAKKAFNQIVNSDRSSRNENQWHRFAPDLEPLDKPKDWNEWNKYERNKVRCEAFQGLYGRSYPDLIRSLIEKHEPIDDYFFSKAWGPMQRKDSDIAERVMLKLLDAEVPITALPIHDSFIVRRGVEKDLENAMNEAFEEVTGTKGRMKGDEAVYDKPEGYDRKERIIWGGEMHNEVRENIIGSKEYNKREVEWMEANGQID